MAFAARSLRVRTESVGLAYAKIQVDYFGQDEKGAKEAAPKTFTYDLPANAK